MEIYFPWEHEEHMTSLPADPAKPERSGPTTGTIAVAAELTGDGAVAVDDIAAGLETLSTATGLTPREIADRLTDG